MDTLGKYFELILFLLVLITGIASMLDYFWLAKKRQAAKMPWWADYSRSFFPVLLLVFVVRSFIIEPYRIPSGSLEPTLLTGDFVAVNKFTYGLRWPVWHKKFFAIHEPKRGDIFVFRWPADPSVDYIKRVIGLPGDHIVYKDKVLSINGKIMPQRFVRDEMEIESNGEWHVEKREENLDGVKHDIYIRPDMPAVDFDIVVPEGQYFAMGDNRDNSNDSRYWGSVPEENLIGKALWVLLSWDSQMDGFRWPRSLKTVH